MIRKTILVRALSLAFGATALSTAMITPVMAQSNAAGNIFGRVEGGAGASVVLQNLDTGSKRTVTLDSSGRYNATAMSPGRYKVEVQRDGKVVNTSEVEVLVGQGVEASFGAAVQSVQVTGRRSRIDVSNTNNGAVFTAKELAKLPVAANVDAIIQLAPNTTRADSRYAAGASFGGGGASENAYYINGFVVTNPLTQLGASELPFGAIGQAQILTGGFGAEFGRSVGGVVNITTKSGTNNWEAGATFSLEPNSMRSRARDVYYSNTGHFKDTDGTLFRRKSDDTVTKRTYGGYVGGPIIKDKLFMFVAVERKKDDRTGVNDYANTVGFVGSPTLGTTGWAERQDTADRYLGKFDWNINDNHRLELTLIGDNNKEDRQLYGYDYVNGRKYVRTSSEHYKNNSNYTPVGADSQVLRYTGNITDDFTVSALYGKSKTKITNTYDGDLSNLFQINAAPATRVPGLNYGTSQVLVGNISPSNAKNDTKSMRLDLEYKLGSHTLRGGFDNNKLKSIDAGDMSAGGGLWFYGHTDTPDEEVLLSGVPVIVSSGGGYGKQGYFVSRRLFNTATNAYSDQDAKYLEDRWQVTKDVLLTFGVRSEGFKNKNGDGETFLEVKNQISPRLSAAWDVNGDASFKVFGSAGRYALQIPTHLAVRGASRALNTREYFTYTGTDANGNPLGLKNLTGVLSTNNEFYQAKDPKTLTTLDIKPTYQDEITAGFEKALSADLNVGAKVTYRKLKETIDDYCDSRPFKAWAKRNGVDPGDWELGCVTFNPGRDNSFLVDFKRNKQYTQINLSKEEIGFDKAERKYTALDLFAEHPLRNGWYGRVNYTWSRSKGNTEGQTRSDNAQTDVAATSTWDFPELMRGSNGRLPNDRKHQIKAFGFYEISPEWTVGGNFLAASGRPRSCFGQLPKSMLNGSDDYGSVYFWCDGKPVNRGTLGDLPWDVRLDMNLAYRPAFIKGLTLKVDVFNVANKQVAQNMDETFNGDGGAYSANYGRVISYTAPRSAKFTVEYNHRF